MPLFHILNDSNKITDVVEQVSKVPQLKVFVITFAFLDKVVSSFEYMQQRNHKVNAQLRSEDNNIIRLKNRFVPFAKNTPY